MKKIFLFLILISLPLQSWASFHYWFNKTTPGTRHYWVNGYDPGSRHYWENGVGPGSRLFWENAMKYPSRHFWENGTKPGSSWYWTNGKGPGSRHYYENGLGPGSLHYWNNKDGVTFDVYFIAICKAGVIDLPPCSLLVDDLDPLQVLPMAPDFHYCEEVKEGVRMGLPPGHNHLNSKPNSQINSKPNSR